MTNKTEEELVTYDEKGQTVNHLSIQRNDYIILNVALIRYDKYGKSSTHFSHFWAKINL